MLGLYLDTFIKSHILQYVKYTKWINILLGIAKFHDQ